MRDAVRKNFLAFTSPLEGVVPFMYLDVKGLVTTAIGNLIDATPHPQPWLPALTCPFVHKSGEKATAIDIRREWEYVKSLQSWSQRGGGAFGVATNLRLTKEGIEQIVFRKLDEMVGQLKRRFPGFDEWPADAQLGTISMAWACGPNFYFPIMAAALKDENFRLAALHCHINTDNNPGVIPRNKANVICFENAAFVKSSGLLNEALDHDTLYWPYKLKEAESDFAIVHASPYQEPDKDPEKA